MEGPLDKNNIQVDFDHPMDISIPLRDGYGNPNCYYSDPPEFTAIVQGDFTGSVAKGGPCNHQRLAFAPHGNGTHTECYGHLSPDPEITINSCLKRFHFLATLISVQPRETDDGDQVILWKDVERLLEAEVPEALIIRTLPNVPQKLTRQYSGSNPPYLGPRFGAALADLNIEHLLVDLPSVDKEEDGGKLLNHHGFWSYPHNPRRESTITELIFVPDSIDDGNYLLNLQISSVESDASPSKPVLYNFMIG